MANDRLSNGCHLLQLWRNKQSGPIPASYCTNQPSDPIYPRWSDSKNQPVRPTSRWLPVQNCELDDRSFSTNLMHWKSITPSQFSLPDFETKTHYFQPNHKWTEEQLLDSFNHSQPCGYQRQPWRPNRYEPPKVYLVRNYATEPDSNYAHNLFNQEQDCQTATQSSSRNPRFFEKTDVDTHWSTQFHCVCCRFNGRWQWNPYQEAVEGPSYAFSPNKGKTFQYYHDSRMRNTSTCEVGCQYQPIHYWPGQVDKPFTIWSSNLDSSTEHTAEKRFRPKDIFATNYGLNKNNSSPMHITRRSGSPRSDRSSSCFEEQTDSAGAQSTTVIEDVFQDQRILNHHTASNRKQTLKRKSNQHTRPTYSVQRSEMQINESDRGGLEKVQNELQTASAFYATPKDRAPRPRSASPPEPRGLTTSKTHHCIGTAQPSFFLEALATSTPRVKQILANQDDIDGVDRQDVSHDKTTAERSGNRCCSEHAEIDDETTKQTKSNITDYSLSDDQFHEKYYMRVEE
ncbi:uncharacterized protein DEA37_0003804 [Paragonimus westermani]|uniref:Uncharacterized protein n=1 Tax=Paragonimus westermani TaxID=34504 RepID=A0A5J4NL38_9TREM|nr:uncharacterized protein DEA37_0003804 [Paragonimus westermani]